jgi:hypothetical protein
MQATAGGVTKPHHFGPVNVALRETDTRRYQSPPKKIHSDAALRLGTYTNDQSLKIPNMTFDWLPSERSWIRLGKCRRYWSNGFIHHSHS